MRNTLDRGGMERTQQRCLQVTAAMLLVALAMLLVISGCISGPRGYAQPTGSDATDALRVVEDIDTATLSSAFGRRISTPDAQKLRYDLMGSRVDATFGSMAIPDDPLTPTSAGERVARISTGGGDWQAGVMPAPNVVSGDFEVVFAKREGRWYVVAIRRAPSSSDSVPPYLTSASTSADR